MLPTEKEIQTPLKRALPTSDNSNRWWAHLAFKEYIPDCFLSRNGVTMWVTASKPVEAEVDG